MAFESIFGRLEKSDFANTETFSRREQRKKPMLVTVQRNFIDYFSSHQPYVAAKIEKPFTGKYNDTKEKGVFRCACCGNELFRSDKKFDSGTGWPSFWGPIDPERVKTEEDYSHGMRRVEVMCARCDAHLGHLFPDGPQPTGDRYCMNSCSLDLVADAADPADR